MATESQKKRRELKEKRLAAEKQAKGQDTRQSAVKAIAAVAFLAVIAVIVVIVVAVSGGGEDDGSKSSGEIEKLLAGIPQNGTVLGNPNAPATVVEFADLECASCKQFAEGGLPDLIKSEVRPGRARLDLRFLQTASGDFEAAKAALAASNQGRFWQFIEYFYANQGVAGTGYVTDDFLTDIAEQAGVLDIDRWNEDRNLPKWDEVLLRDDELAAEVGATGTPTFAIEQADGSFELIPPEPFDSIDEIKKAIRQAQ